MAFLSDRESIILMDTPMINGRLFTTHELEQFRDAGIQTVMWCGPFWDGFITGKFDTPEYHWEYLESYVDRARRAGLKVILGLWWRQGTHYPEQIYVRKQNGDYHPGMFSPWCKEAQALSNHVLELVRDRLTSPDCLVISAQAEGGERVLLNKPAYYDNYALKDWLREHPGKPTHTTIAGYEWLRQSYVKLLLEQQRILVQGMHHEIWYMLSLYKPQVTTLSCHGCEWIPDYIDAWRTLNPAGINHLTYNYFPYGPQFYPTVEHERTTYGVNEFVGAEYCEGLKSGNGRIAIDNHMRGMLVGPCHPFTKHTRVEPWMLEEISKATKAFEEARYAAKETP